MYLLNAFSLNMIEAPASIMVEAVDLDGAKGLLSASGAIDSAVGHPSTAAVFAQELGVDVACERRTVALVPGDVAIVGQYKGPRLAEGATELPEGAEIEWLRVEVMHTPEPEREPAPEPARVRVKPPVVGDHRFKRWSKLIESVNTARDNGYAFEGPWCPKRDFEARVGQLILAYGEEGSHRYHAPVVRLYKVSASGKLELLDEAEGRSWALDLRDVAAEAL